MSAADTKERPCHCAEHLEEAAAELRRVGARLGPETMMGAAALMRADYMRDAAQLLREEAAR